MKNLISLLVVLCLFLTCQPKKTEPANRSGNTIDSIPKSLMVGSVGSELTLGKTLQYESGGGDYVKIRFAILPNHRVRFLFYLGREQVITVLNAIMHGIY